MKIKNSLIFAFMVWMKIGGHGLSEKRGAIVMRKGEKMAKILIPKDGYSELNDYCSERYLIFLKQWLDIGVSFIDELVKKGDMEIARLRKYSYLELLK